MMIEPLEMPVQGVTVSPGFTELWVSGFPGSLGKVATGEGQRAGRGRSNDTESEPTNRPHFQAR